jgi:hypothetical protein
LVCIPWKNQLPTWLPPITDVMKPSHLQCPSMIIGNWTYSNKTTWLPHIQVTLDTQIWIGCNEKKIWNAMKENEMEDYEPNTKT